MGLNGATSFSTISVFGTVASCNSVECRGIFPSWKTVATSSPDIETVSTMKTFHRVFMLCTTHWAGDGIINLNSENILPCDPRPRANYMATDVAPKIHAGACDPYIALPSPGLKPIGIFFLDGRALI